MRISIVIDLCGPLLWFFTDFSYYDYDYYIIYGMVALVGVQDGFISAQVSESELAHTTSEGKILD